MLLDLGSTGAGRASQGDEVTVDVMDRENPEIGQRLYKNYGATTSLRFRNKD